VILDDLFGIVTENEQEICFIKYDWITYDDQTNLFCISLYNKWGFIDKSGKEICPIKYDWIDFIKNGYYKVSINGKYGYIDTTGKEYIDLPR
jgi:hypothetical protein